MQIDALPIGRSASLFAVLALLLVLIALVVLARRRSARRSPDRDEATGPAGPAAPESGSANESSERELSPRVLAAYVRTLEETLAEQDERLHEVGRSADQLLLLTQRRQAQRVQCTLSAMRERLANQPAEVVMNRVEAALTRLGSSSQTTRPLLAAGPSGSTPVAFAAVRDHPPVASLPVQEAETPLAPIDPEPVDPAPDHAEIDTIAAPHRVLPVPARVQAGARSRSGRRFGRSRVS